MVAALIVTARTLQLGLVLDERLPTGGDLAAHPWWPDFLREQLLVRGRLSGWAPDWYAGFPAGLFYFPVPALAVVALDLVAPYPVAFKVVVVAAPLLLPVAAHRLVGALGLARPAPVLAGLGAVAFLHVTGDNRILGGNLASLAVGEYAYSVALTLGLFALAAVFTAVDGRSRGAAAAVLLAATVCSHVVVGLVISLCALGVLAVHPSKHAIAVVGRVGGSAALVSSVWVLPVLVRHAESTDVGWVRRRDHLGALFGARPTAIGSVITLAAIVVVIAKRRTRRSSHSRTGLARMHTTPHPQDGILVLGVWTVVAAAVFILMPGTTIWNARVLPLFRLLVWLAAAAAIGSLLAALFARSSETGRSRAPRAAWAMGHMVMAGLSVTTLALGWTRSDGVARALAHDFGGTRGLGAAGAEHDALVAAIGGLGPTRILWEHGTFLRRYGSRFALDALPLLTDGRVATAEGLFAESALTAPAVYRTIAQVSVEPFRRIRGLDYGSIADFETGIESMRALGIRHYLAYSAPAREAAAASDGLRFVADTGLGWLIYEIVGWGLVDDPAITVDRGRDWIRLSGTTPGRLISVRESWASGWDADGATEARPRPDARNLMTITPVSTEVTLRYGRSGTDDGGVALFVLGVVAVGRLARAPRPVRSRVDPEDAPRKTMAPRYTEG